jgi:hypothetical protein
MPRLVINYMRPLAILVLLIISTLILFSFFLIPKIFITTLPDFYHHYWNLLSWLFLISILLLSSAFVIERADFSHHFLGHILVMSLVLWFVFDMLDLIKGGFMSNINEAKVIRVGGWSLIAFAFLFLGIQIYLRFVVNYPDILRAPDTTALPLLASGGPHLAFVLTLLALLPLLLIPGSVGAYYAFREHNEASMRTALIFALIAVVALTLCLMRWPSLNWYIALSYTQDPGQRGLLSAISLALNTYLGTYLGGILASVAASIWFFITCSAMLHDKGFPKWIAYTGIVAGIYLILAITDRIGMVSGFISTLFRLVAPIDVVWLLIFGVGLLIHPKAS